MKRTIWTTEISQKHIKELMADCELSETEAYESANEAVYLQLDDEKTNLDIPTDNPILVIAELGLWNGRRSAYKVLSHCNVKEIFSAPCRDSNDVDFYADAYNVYCDDSHHDGTNHYLFRELTGSEDECYKLLDAIAQGRDYKALMKRYSRSILPYVADTFGWPMAGRKKKPA